MYPNYPWFSEKEYLIRKLSHINRILNPQALSHERQLGKSGEIPMGMNTNAKYMDNESSGYSSCDKTWDKTLVGGNTVVNGIQGEANKIR